MPRPQKKPTESTKPPPQLHADGFPQAVSTARAARLCVCPFCLEPVATCGAFCVPRNGRRALYIWCPMCRSKVFFGGDAASELFRRAQHLLFDPQFREALLRELMAVDLEQPLPPIPD